MFFLETASLPRKTKSVKRKIDKSTLNVRSGRVSMLYPHYYKVQQLQVSHGFSFYLTYPYIFLI